MKVDNWILKQAETAPGRLAVDDGNTQLTFLELKQQVSQLAGQLKAASVLDGDRVGIMTKNSLLGYLMAMAVLGSGKTIVWINWRLSDDEIHRQLSDSEPAACLVADDLFRESFDQRFITFSTITDQAAVQITLVPEFRSQEVASIMYTSGTTGRPKGVMQTSLAITSPQQPPQLLTLGSCRVTSGFAPSQFFISVVFRL